MTTVSCVKGLCEVELLCLGQCQSVWGASTDGSGLGHGVCRYATAQYFYLALLHWCMPRPCDILYGHTHGSKSSNLGWNRPGPAVK